MLCACSLPACTSTPSEESLLTCAKENATLLLRLYTRRAFILAIVCIMLLLLVYAAGFESFLVEYHYDRGEEAQHARKLLTEFHHDEQKSAAYVPKYWNRKFLREGTDSADDSKKESNLELLNLLQEGPLLGSDGGKFSGGNSTIPGRRSLIPATNVCTNKDISISQGPDGSSGIPRYFVQIVNTCMSDCAPSQVHVFCDECTNKDISITQRRDGSPGIPRFNVQIVNTCLSDCAPADIHVYCGWFASSPPPNPNTFQRLSYNDCLVNGGRPLGHGAIIQFQYANSFMYPIQFRSARFCR